jgi:hypothetical protein
LLVAAKKQRRKQHSIEPHGGATFIEEEVPE